MQREPERPLGATQVPRAELKGEKRRESILSSMVAPFPHFEVEVAVEEVHTCMHILACGHRAGRACARATVALRSKAGDVAGWVSLPVC